MIVFLRKIRQQLLNENRLSKYLLYAIGEILLVVIGILIALQINNWNEDRKNRENEAYILGEILNNLREHAIQIRAITKARGESKSAVTNMFKYLNESNISSDTLAKDVGNFLRFERYYPLSNAYEMMKSTGLKVANNQLGTAISRYYDFEQSKIA